MICPTENLLVAPRGRVVADARFVLVLVCVAKEPHVSQHDEDSQGLELCDASNSKFFFLGCHCFGSKLPALANVLVFFSVVLLPPFADASLWLMPMKGYAAGKIGDTQSSKTIVVALLNTSFVVGTIFQRYHPTQQGTTRYMLSPTTAHLTTAVAIACIQKLEHCAQKL